MPKRTPMSQIDSLMAKPQTTSEAAPEQDPVIRDATKKRASNLFVEMNPETKAALKMLALEKGTSLKLLMAEFINDGFRKYDKPPLADE